MAASQPCRPLCPCRPWWKCRREAFRGEALRPSLEGLGQEMGEPDLPIRRGAEGDGARDARAPLDARRRERRLRSRGGCLTRSRIERRDHDAELREAGGGSLI